MVSVVWLLLNLILISILEKCSCIFPLQINILRIAYASPLPIKLLVGKTVMIIF